MGIAEFDRLSEGIEWIDVEFVERERTPERIVEVGIQLHLAGLLRGIELLDDAAERVESNDRKTVQPRDP